MRSKGFSLIELIIVIIVLVIVGVVAVQKFINIQDEAKKSVMLSMKGAITSADSLAAFKINLNPTGLNGNQNRFTLDNGDQIRVRGRLPDGRWDITFAFLVNFDDTAQISSNDCIDESLKWCVRQRGANWFFSRGYSEVASGRGFVIFPFGYNVNSDRCYIYHLNKNDTTTPETVQPTIIGSDFSEC